jgi:hypothetical protein
MQMRLYRRIDEGLARRLGLGFTVKCLIAYGFGREIPPAGVIRPVIVQQVLGLPDGGDGPDGMCLWIFDGDCRLPCRFLHDAISLRWDLESCAQKGPTSSSKS